MVKKIKTYFTGVVEEMKKVTFPTRQETIAMATLVIVICLLISIYVSLLDFGFSSFTKWLISN